MFELMYDLVVSSFKNYMGDGYIYILFIIALAFMFIFKFSNDDRCLFLYPSCLMIVVIFFPPTAKIIALIIGETVYWRVFWLLPVMLVIPYVAVRVMDKFKSFIRSIIMIVVIITIIFTGTFIFTDVNFPAVQTVYKIPKEAIQVCEIIDEHTGEKEEKRAIMSADLTPYVRQYDASVMLMYGRMILSTEQDQVWHCCNDNMVFTSQLTEYAIAHEYNYLALRLSFPQTEPFENYGFYEIGTTENYVIYKYEG